jgi:CRP/FNR family transcriptional regulator, anaerobic regulatory protein
MNTCPSSAAGDFDPPQIPLSCSACPACARNLCQAVARAIGSFPDDPSIEVPQSVHLINARRVIHWGQDFHDVVPLICEGWAASMYILSDGSRQILSILLPGDLASTALLFGAQAGCSVEAITDVRYRTFAQADLKARLLNDADCFARFLRACIDETARADQLITDLGRRTAAERAAWRSLRRWRWSFPYAITTSPMQQDLVSSMSPKCCPSFAGAASSRSAIVP